MPIVGAEQELFDRGVRLQENEDVNHEMPEHLGCVLVAVNDQGELLAEVHVQAGMSQDWRDFAAEGALERIDRFAEHGPEPDGWQLRSDGAWQLWLRPVQLDPWLTER